MGFCWAQRNQERIKGLAYMEAFVRPLTWDEWPERARPLFRELRSPAGEEMVLQKNLFVEDVLPMSVIRTLRDEEMLVYRRPYIEPGESRRPTLVWPREIPFDGEPADVAEIFERYSRWLAESNVPKLFINGERRITVKEGPALNRMRPLIDWATQLRTGASEAPVKI